MNLVHANLLIHQNAWEQTEQNINTDKHTMTTLMSSLTGILVLSP